MVRMRIAARVRIPSSVISNRNMSSQLPPPLPFVVLRGHKESISCIKFTRNSLGIVSGSLDGEVRLWDVEIRRTKATIAAHVGSVLSVHSIDLNLVLRYFLSKTFHTIFGLSIFLKFRKRWDDPVVGCEQSPRKHLPSGQWIQTFLQYWCSIHWWWPTLYCCIFEWS